MYKQQSNPDWKNSEETYHTLKYNIRVTSGSRVKWISWLPGSYTQEFLLIHEQTGF